MKLKFVHVEDNCHCPGRVTANMIRPKKLAIDFQLEGNSKHSNGEQQIGVEVRLKWTRFSKAVV